MSSPTTTREAPPDFTQEVAANESQRGPSPQREVLIYDVLFGACSQECRFGSVPRHNARRTRIRCATKSTSSHGSPKSSPCRIPVRASASRNVRSGSSCASSGLAVSLNISFRITITSPMVLGDKPLPSRSRELSAALSARRPARLGELTVPFAGSPSRVGSRPPRRRDRPGNASWFRSCSHDDVPWKRVAARAGVLVFP